MSEITYWRQFDDLVYQKEKGMDFISPASQSVLRRWNSPYWEPVFGSRSTYPSWQRPDIYREIDYVSAKNARFIEPRITFPAAIVNPSGMLDFRLTTRTAPMQWSDREKYHHNTQKIFSIFLQFDTLTTDQVMAFSGIDDKEEVEHRLEILHSSRILQKTLASTWSKEDKVGPIWRMMNSSPFTQSYYEGMDALSKMLTIGGGQFPTPPPGAGVDTAVKHNIFAAETMLRIAESCDNVIGVWGDRFSGDGDFRKYAEDDIQRYSQGDCVVVTKDGSIVVFEIVGSMTSRRAGFRKIVEKAASWVGVIAGSTLDISVIFMDITWIQDRRMLMNAIHRGVNVEAAAYAPDEYSRIHAAQKIGISSATWWYPDDTGSTSKLETRLGVYVPYTHKYALFDEPDFSYSTPEIRKNVVINSISALHTPPWILGDIKGRKV